MCCKLGNPFSTKIKHSKLMREGDVLAATWSLHIGSYLMASMPYLQFISLVLAMTASILTIIKMTKKPKKGE